MKVVFPVGLTDRLSKGRDRQYEIIIINHILKSYIYLNRLHRDNSYIDPRRFYMKNNKLYVRLRSDDFQDLYNNYSRILKSLEEKNILEIDHSYSVNNHKSKGYRIKHEVFKVDLFDNTKNFYREDIKLSKVAERNINKLNNKIKDKMKKKKNYKIEYPENPYVEDHLMNSLQKCELVISDEEENKIVNEMTYDQAEFYYRFKLDIEDPYLTHRIYGRYYHNICTSSKKFIRPYLRINGSKLVEIDIANCHPFLISHIKEFKMYNQFYTMKISDNEIPETEDWFLFKDLTERGELWNYIENNTKLTRDVIKLNWMYIQNNHITYKNKTTDEFRRLFPSVIQFIDDIKSNDKEFLKYYTFGIESYIIYDEIYEIAWQHFDYIITIHDSFLIPEEDVEKFMQFLDFILVNLKVKIPFKIKHL